MNIGSSLVSLNYISYFLFHISLPSQYNCIHVEPKLHRLLPLCLHFRISLQKQIRILTKLKCVRFKNFKINLSSVYEKVFFSLFFSHFRLDQSCIFFNISLDILLSLYLTSFFPLFQYLNIFHLS